MAYLRRAKNSKIWHIVEHVNGRRREFTTGTDNHGIARVKLKKLEYERVTGDISLPTRTPVAELLDRYCAYLRAQQPGPGNGKGAQTDINRLATWFGPTCDGLKENPRRAGRSQPEKGRRIAKGHRKYVAPLGVAHLEEITTGMVKKWLKAMAARRGLAAKTLNGYREILQRFIKWAMEEDVRMPRGLNPAHKVKRYKEHRHPIRFLTREQIHRQLDALADHPQVQAMVATLIYAGLRREEMLRLTPADVDLGAGYIRVRAKTVNGEFWQPKTGEERSVPISSALRVYLESYSPPPGSPWHFPSPQCGLWDGDNFAATLRRLSDKPATGLRQLSGKVSSKLTRLTRHFSAEIRKLSGVSGAERRKLQGKVAAELRELKKTVSARLRELRRTFSAATRKLDGTSDAELRRLNDAWSDGLEKLDAQFSAALRKLNRVFSHASRRLSGQFGAELHGLETWFSDELQELHDQVEPRWTPLHYRHTFGSQLAMKGITLYKISKLMGNSPEICRKHYAALLPESVVGCVEFDDKVELPLGPDEVLDGDDRPELRVVGWP